MKSLERIDIESAIEFAAGLSPEELRKMTGANKSIKYFLIQNGKEYEAKVLVQLAWNLKHPENRIDATNFRGDVSTVAQPLREIGFDVVERNNDRYFGHVSGIAVGTTFANRAEASAAGIHRPRQAGISGSGNDGADSIVVSGGYVDDEDFGNRIIYTGHGGNDPNTRKQVADQVLKSGNLALAISCDQQLPVRVLRGANGDPVHSPSSGYRYDGVFSVDRYWREVGSDGFLIWRFELSQIDDEWSISQSDEVGDGQPERRVARSMNVIVRNSSLATWVKQIHNWHCQLCSARITTHTGAYAEAAHIRPLGTPHNGPDQTSNILCLCPNCHKRFDAFVWHVSDAGQVVDTITRETLGDLRLDPRHQVGREHLAYHREQCMLLSATSADRGLGPA